MTGIFDDDSYDEWDIIAKYYYDDRGFRIKKKVGTLCTYYVRDLSGNILSIYTGNETTALQKEMAVYGSGRLGTAAVDGQGEFIESYLYELTDHLGNVRATLKDNYNGNGILNSYADYYPGGMPMPGAERTSVSSGDYKFGYQGQFAEKDQETGFNQFELRLYDARIGRWMAPDPYGQYWSPYMGMGNNPINGVDPDGGFFGGLRANINAFFTGGTVVEGKAGNWYVQHSEGGFKSFGQSGFRGKADLSHIQTSFEVGDIAMTGDFDQAPIFGGGEFNLGQYLHNNPADFRYLMEHAGNRATQQYLFNANFYYGREQASKQVLAWTIAVPTTIIVGAEVSIGLASIPAMGKVGNYGYRFAKHGPHHQFGKLGKLPHYQLNTWKYGVKGSGRTLYRMPLPK